METRSGSYSLKNHSLGWHTKENRIDWKINIYYSKFLRCQTVVWEKILLTLTCKCLCWSRFLVFARWNGMCSLTRLSFDTATAFLSSAFSGFGCKSKISPHVGVQEEIFRIRLSLILFGTLSVLVDTLHMLHNMPISVVWGEKYSMLITIESAFISSKNALSKRARASQTQNIDEVTYEW